ncbi:hypothetical protein RCL1_008807 [Eukaryota sp. TZLM3-RCL]
MYCTVMTYESGQYFEDRQDAILLPVFSNPNLGAEGFVFGHAEDADNVRTIQETMAYISTYRVPLFEALGIGDNPNVNLLSTSEQFPSSFYGFVSHEDTFNNGVFVRSGEVITQSASVMALQVTGPVQVSFSMRSVIQNQNGVFVFYIDDQLQVELRGVTEWKQYSFTIQDTVNLIFGFDRKDLTNVRITDGGFIGGFSIQSGGQQARKEYVKCSAETSSCTSMFWFPSLYYVAPSAAVAVNVSFEFMYDSSFHGSLMLGSSWLGFEGYGEFSHETHHGVGVACVEEVYKDNDKVFYGWMNFELKVIPTAEAGHVAQCEIGPSESDTIIVFTAEILTENGVQRIVSC